QRVGGRSRRLRIGRSTGLSAKADSKVPWLCEPTSGSNRYVRIRPELDSVVRISPEGNGAAGVTYLGATRRPGGNSGSIRGRSKPDSERHSRSSGRSSRTRPEPGFWCSDPVESRLQRMSRRLESVHVGYSNGSAPDSGGGRELRDVLGSFVGDLQAIFAQARGLVSHCPFLRPPDDRNKGGHEQDRRRDRQVPAEARAPRRGLVRDRTANRALTSARSPERLAGRGRGDGTAVGGVRTRLQEGGRYRGE